MTVAEIRLERGTTAAWEADNRILASGEPGWDMTLKRMKVGDGVTHWNDLDWATSPDGGGGGSGSIETVNGDDGPDVVLDAASVGAKPASYVPAWSEITSKPTTFPPATHAHVVADTTGLQTLLDGLQPIDPDLSAIAALTTAAYGRGLLTLAEQAGLLTAIGTGTESAKGVLQLASEAEHLAGVNTAKAATVAGVAAIITQLIGAAPSDLNSWAELVSHIEASEDDIDGILTAIAGKQDSDATLSAFAAVATAANKLIYADGVDSFATCDFTAQARQLLDDTTFTAMRSTLGLGDSATKNVGTSAGTVAAGDDSRITGAAPTASPTFTGIPVTPALSVTGLSGATAGTREVGAVASGPPTSGTWVLGDSITDLAGKKWVCSVAGTPGYWSPADGESLDPHAVRQMNRLIAKLTAGVEDAVIVLTGDSTGNDATDWFYIWITALAALFPAYTVNHQLFVDASKTYAGATTIQTGTGTKTLTVLNGSVAGQASGYGVTNFATEFTSTPDLTIVNYGHNNTTSTFAADMTTLLDLIASTYPTTGIIVSGQNPRTDSTANADLQYRRMTALRELCAKAGHGYVDVMQTFLNSGSTWSSSWMNGDGIHPNSTGFQKWRDEWLRYLKAARRAVGTLQRPTGTPTGSKFLRDDNTWAAPPGGSVSGKILSGVPTGSFGSTVPRWACNNGSAVGTTGQLKISLIYLDVGDVVSSIIIPATATGGSSLTHSLAGLYSAHQTAPVLLAGSADDTTATWSALTARTFTMTAPYTVTVAGFYYIGCFVVGTTLPAFYVQNAGQSTGLASRPPITGAVCNSGLTTALPNPASTPTVNASQFYAEVA